MAQPGTLEAFTDFMIATRGLPLAGPNEIFTQLTKHRTYVSRIILAKEKAKDYFQGGTHLEAALQLSYTPNAAEYNPGDTQSPVGDTSLTKAYIPWAFTLVYSVWYDHEIVLNRGEQVQFANLAMAKRRKMWVDFWDHVEDCLWAAPNSQMEKVAGTETKRIPYSIRAFITKTGGAPTKDDDGADVDWTTVEQINPTTYTNWKNQVITYNATNYLASLPPALDEMWMAVQFQAPPADGGPSGQEDTDLRKMRIMTNKEGMKMLLAVNRELKAGNSKVPLVDLSYTNGVLTFNGMPIDYISKLDSVFEEGKPCFYFINFDHIKLRFHRERYLYAKTFEGTFTQPHANVEYRDTWWNLVCTNRREQGIVIPEPET